MPNRIVKAAMTECMATSLNHPSAELISLYAHWGQTGCGALLTGNVMVDSRYMENPRNVAIELGDDGLGSEYLKRWSAAGKAGGSLMIMQVSHAGRQCPVSVNAHPIAPSAVSFASVIPGVFRAPREMTENEISEVVSRFAHVARTAKETGFDGVQVHSAHGYLISSFLSPRTNRRTDRWGGSLENRMRLLVEVVKAVRVAVGPRFAVWVKVNTSDFQKDGFSEADCLATLHALAGLGVDLVELSGGSYEFAAMMQSDKSALAKEGVRQSTLDREAFFIDFARTARKGLAGKTLPLMLTGGLRSRGAMEQCLGIVDVVGLARPLCWDLSFVRGVLAGTVDSVTPPSLAIGIKDLDAGLENLWHQRQMARIARGLKPDYSVGRLWCLTGMTVRSYILDPRKNPIRAAVWAVALAGMLFLVLEHLL
jgi:2,4-dienoyl-CoA reductase-like NADH-dependent reductase (Old Yellow Enzyme family)